jgi:hypothetical protein
MALFNDQSLDYHNPDRYLTLLSSLPANLSLFAAKKTPLSRLKLEQKLTLLAAPERQLLADIEGVLQWGYLSAAMKHEYLDDGSLLPVREIKRVLATINDRQLKQLVCEKLDFRTLLGALRHRHQNADQPLQGEWTVSRFKHTIESNWQEPYFRLEHARPWLIEAKQLIDDDQPLLLEKLLLHTAWQHLSRAAAQQTFSFYSLVVYVLKWNIVERWTRYDGEAAASRFQQLIAESLANLPDDVQGEE